MTPSPSAVPRLPSSELGALRSGRVRRWPGLRIRSTASVTQVLIETARALGLRVNGPVTSVVLASQVDTPDDLLQAHQVHAWVETDRRDDRRDGWMTDRVGLAGRWVVMNDNIGIYAYGVPGEGPIGAHDLVWRSALGGNRPEDLGVRSWQRVDRTSWVVHDGDGLVLGEFVVDEQRQMGTHESGVDVRLISDADHEVFAVVVDAISAHFGSGVIVPTGESLTIDLNEAAVVLDDLGVNPTPAALEAHRSALWIIRAALEVEELARSSRPIVERDVRALSTLIGAAPLLEANHQSAAEQLRPMLRSALVSHRTLAHEAHQRWARNKVAGRMKAKTGHRIELVEAFDHRTEDAPASPSTPELSSLGQHASTLRAVVLMLIEDDPAPCTSPVLLDALRDALGDWLSGPRTIPKVIDSRRTVAVRAAIAALLQADENNPTPLPKGIVRDAELMERDLRWIGRRVVLVETITWAASVAGLAPGTMLVPEVWMDLGVMVDRTHQRVTTRLSAARRRATRLFREVSDVAERERATTTARR